MCRTLQVYRCTCGFEFVGVDRMSASYQRHDSGIVYILSTGLPSFPSSLLKHLYSDLKIPSLKVQTNAFRLSSRSRIEEATAYPKRIS